MKFKTKKFLLRSKTQEAALLKFITELPLSDKEPLQVVIQEYTKARNNEQNAKYWAMLKDISEQIWLNKRKYLPEVWHEYFKELYLPDFAEIGVISKDNYVKWMLSIGGERILVGSTSDFTTKGFSEYLEKIYVYANEATEGQIKFTAADNEY